jgi:hypothetical protein
MTKIELEFLLDSRTASCSLIVEWKYLPCMWIPEGELAMAPGFGAAVDESGEDITRYLRVKHSKSLRY